MKNKIGMRKKLAYKNAIVIFLCIFTLEILSIGLNRLAQYAMTSFTNISFGWLFNPLTHDMEFVGIPSLVAVFLNSFGIGYLSGKNGVINAVAASTVNGMFWALINVLPYNPSFMTQGYIFAMLQIIPYYFIVSLIGGSIGRQIKNRNSI